MYVVIEAWTPCPEFLDLPVAARMEFFSAVREGVAKLAEGGIDCLGWGRLDQVIHGLAHEWVAVWTMPSPGHADILLNAVVNAGWYDWFTRTNMRAELVTPDLAIDEHIKLAG